MLNRKYRRVYCSQSCISNHNRAQVQTLHKVVDYDMLLIIPAQGADYTAASLHRKVIVFCQCPLEVLIYLVKINLRMIDICCKMR